MHVDAAHVALQAKLGAGGFGSVWQGWWRGRMVAVKVMHRNLFEQPYGPDLLSSFQQEVELLSRYAAPGEGSTRKNHPG
jgi:serine/threonine protein kinase